MLSHRIRDLRGLRNGHLEVLAFSHLTEGQRRAVWDCRCWICGRIVSVRADHLTKKQNPQSTCWDCARVRDAETGIFQPKPELTLPGVLTR